LLFEFFAWHTLRPTADHQIFGALPFQKKSIANYYLFRHFSKTAWLVFFVSIAFFAGTDFLGIKLLRFFAGLGLLVTLQLISFLQAYSIRNPHHQRLTGKMRWLIPEIFIIGLLVVCAEIIQSALSSPLNIGLFGMLSAWIIIPILFVFIQRHFTPYAAESKTFQKSIADKNTRSLIAKTHGPKRAFIFRDLIFLWRQKRFSLLLPVISSIILSVVSLRMENANDAYISLICLQFFLGILLLNTVLTLFENDVLAYELIRSLPITAGSLWLSRWIFIVGLMSLPMILPIFIIPIKFKIGITFVWFVFAALAGLPMLLATLFCNAGFGLFPHIKLCGYIIIISIVLIILFWFFMPFGSLLVLGVMFFWIRRAQKRFQYLELM